MWRAEIKSLNLEQVMRLAQAMVTQLPKKLTLGITGTLGAGKTTLVQFIAEAAGIEKEAVTSPTFTLLQSHQGSVKLHHMDAYRINDEDEFLELGVEELFDDNAWTLIEWADRVRDVMPPDTLWMHLSPCDESNHRNIEFTSDTPDLKKIISQLDHCVTAQSKTPH